MISPEDADGGVDLVQAFGGLVHGGDTAVHFFTRTVGNIEQDLGRVGHALNGSDHLDRSRLRFH